jgi:hypothetical protein
MGMMLTRKLGRTKHKVLSEDMLYCLFNRIYEGCTQWVTHATSQMRYMDFVGMQEHKETRTSLIARELVLPSKSPFCASDTPSRCLNTGSRESMQMASEAAALITVLRLSKCSPTDFRRSIRWGDRVHLMNAVVDTRGQGVTESIW